jgi:hypothetical protein
METIGGGPVNQGMRPFRENSNLNFTGSLREEHEFYTFYIHAVCVSCELLAMNFYCLQLQ